MEQCASCKKSIWCIWVSRYLVTPFIGTLGTKSILLMAELQSNLTSVNLSILFFRGFHSNSCGGPGFWPSGTKTLHDFSHIFLSKLCVFGCTWPNCTHYQLQGVVAPGHGTPLAGFFTKPSESNKNTLSNHNLLNTKLTQKRSFALNTSLRILVAHTDDVSKGWYTVIYIYILKYYDMYHVRGLCWYSEVLHKKSSAKCGAELGGRIKPCEILGWRWLLGNVLRISTPGCAADHVVNCHSRL